jgi:DNA-binding transcriptional LysR family regulator
MHTCRTRRGRRADDRSLRFRAQRLLRRANPKREPAAIAESEDWAMALVAAGLGVAIVSQGVARGAVDVAVRPIDIDVKREVGLAYGAKRAPSDALQGFITRLGKPRHATAGEQKLAEFRSRR